MEEGETVQEESAASTLFTPFKLLSWMLSSISMLGHLAATIIRLQIHTLWMQDLVYAHAYQDNYQYDDDYNYYSDDTEEVSSDVTQDVFDKPCVDDVSKEFSIKDRRNDELQNENRMRGTPCDKELNLYELNEGALTYDNGKPLKGILRNCGSCERPFTVSLIPHTNLVLVVADKTCPCQEEDSSLMSPSRVDYSYSDHQIVNTNNSYRQKPWPNIFYHPEEEEIGRCGDLSSKERISASPFLGLILLIFLLVTKY